MALMVVFSDRNVPGADSDEDLRKIASSFRAG